MDKVERRLDSTLKLVQLGMKMLVKMQQETRALQQENRALQKDTAEFRDETRRGINALIAAQMRSEAKVDRLVAALLKNRSNGHSR